VIYSKWLPATGGYEYFEAKGRDIPLGNDLPRPNLPAGTSIGVASIESGRDIPSGARKVGAGALARGMVAPTRRSGSLGSLTSAVPAPYAWFAGGLFTAWLIRKYGK
jgi:hypothetical protein